MTNVHPLNIMLYLKDIVNGILSTTHSDKVNIIAHSKGGLDARWYVADKAANPIDKVANLIMIGTPNSGTRAIIPAAFGWNILCPAGSKGLEDLLPGSEATRAVDQPQSTHYVTIAGHYSPYSPVFAPCRSLVIDYSVPIMIYW